MAKMAVLKHVSKMMDHALSGKMKHKPSHSAVDANGMPNMEESQRHELSESPSMELAEDAMEPKMSEEGHSDPSMHPHDPAEMESDEDKKMLHHMYSQIK